MSLEARAIESAKIVANIHSLDESTKHLVEEAYIQGAAEESCLYSGEVGDFGQAIASLKLGKKVARKGWNGKGMYLWLKTGTTIKAEWCKDPMLLSVCESNGGSVEGLPTICMKTADNKVLTGWLASQTDMLANDWALVD